MQFKEFFHIYHSAVEWRWWFGNSKKANFWNLNKFLLWHVGNIINFNNSTQKSIQIHLLMVFSIHEVAPFCLFCHFLQFLCSDMIQIFNFYFNWGKFVDEIILFPCNIKTNEVPSTIISSAFFSKLNIFNKMWIQEVYVMKMKISNFFKATFFSITLTFIDDYTLNIDKIKEFWSFGLCWPLLAFIGLHWPSLAFIGLCGLGWIF